MAIQTNPANTLTELAYVGGTQAMTLDNPWPTPAQASPSVLVEVGNPERDLLLFDLETGALINHASLKPPVNLLDKLFIAVARCNVAEASQNAYLVLIFYHDLCLKRSDQSYITRLHADHMVDSLTLSGR